MATFNPIPEHIKQAHQNLSAAAQAIHDVNKPYPTFPGHRFTHQDKLNADLERARLLSRQQIGASEPQYNMAINEMGKHGREISPNDIKKYFNPYMHSVINRIAREGTKTFTDKIQPALENKFVRHGQHGSLHHRKESQKFAREIAQDIHEKQQEAMHRGYEHAFSAAKGERERGMEATRLSAILNSLKQASTRSEIEDLMAQGLTQNQAEQALLDFRYQEFLRQSAAPGERLAALSAIIHGLPYSTAQVVYPQTQFAHELGAQQQRHLNTFGQIGNIAGQLLGAGRAMGRI